jgi:hypothetical protein
MEAPGSSGDGGEGGAPAGRVAWEADAAYDWAPFAMAAGPSSSSGGGGLFEDAAAEDPNASTALECQGGWRGEAAGAAGRVQGSLR